MTTKLRVSATGNASNFDPMGSRDEQAMKNELYLLRHARAEPWSPLGNDFSKPLKNSGKRHALAVADWAFSTLPAPDAVLCSPAKRTRETLAPLLARWPQLLSATDYVEPLYGASLNMLYTLAEDAFSYCQRVLMVGHNPGFEAMLMGVLQNHRAADTTKMASGTLAVIEFPQGFGRHNANGRLLHLIRREDLAVSP